MKTTILLILIDLMLASSIAEAVDWRFVTQKQEKFYLLVDQESIENVSDSIFRATVKYEYRKTFKGERAYDCKKCGLAKILSHAVLLEEIDCNTRKTKKLELTEYYTDKAPYHEQLTENWKSASADSVDEILVNYICNQKK